MRTLGQTLLNHIFDPRNVGEGGSLDAHHVAGTNDYVMIWDVPKGYVNIVSTAGKG